MVGGGRGWGHTFRSAFGSRDVVGQKTRAAAGSSTPHQLDTKAVAQIPKEAILAVLACIESA